MTHVGVDGVFSSSDNWASGLEGAGNRAVMQCQAKTFQLWACATGMIMLTVFTYLLIFTLIVLLYCTVLY